MTTASPALPWNLDPSPGHGALPARAHLDSDRPEASLDGAWGFRYASSRSTAVADPAAPDAVFGDTVQVPGHWVLDAANGPLVLGQRNRFGSPWYTNVAYPFPLDPPYVPDADGVGDHLRAFTLEELGFSRDVLERSARVLLRFEGVESAFRVWLNGTELGHAAGSRLTHEFDATAALLAPLEENRLVVRVHGFSAASYLEDQDQWWLPGIFRHVTLIAEPAGGIRDVRAWAEYDAGAGRLALEADAAPGSFPLTLRIPELGIEHVLEAPGEAGALGHTTARIELEVGAVQGWTAETPRLYAAELASATETVRLRLGFRSVRIVDGVFMVNGAPVRFKGVNRHEFHPRTGRAVTEEFTRGELALMKRHNINAIRTSHYPPDHHLLELADELGFWIVDECDLETHGFAAAHWAGNPSADPAWREAYLDRIERTWRRDAHHASVVMFSLGNESGTGENLAAMAAWLREHDPSRPIHYEGDHDAAYTDVYSRMYATPAESESLLRGEPVPSASAEGAARIAAQPYVLCEYAHAMGNGPGGLADYEALFDAYPRAAGGFVWEWKDHGLLAAAPDGGEVHAYGGDFAEPVHDGNFVLDGLVFADGTPTPGLLEYAKVIEPVRITSDVDAGARAGAGGGLTVLNRQDFVDLSAFTFTWSLAGHDGVELASGVLDVPPVAPRTAVRVPDPAEVSALGETGGAATGGVLTVSARLARDTWWAAAGHEVAWGQSVVGAPGATPDAAAAGTPDAVVEAPPARSGAPRFDPAGLLAGLGAVEISGPRLELFRAPTDNDAGSIEPTRDLRPGGVGAVGVEAHAPEGFDWDAHAGTDPADPAPLAERWKAAGLHVLQRRTVSVEPADAGRAVTAVHRWAPPALPLGFETRCAWSRRGDALVLDAEFQALADPGFPLAQLGLAFTLPHDALDDASAVEWYGAGPGESYPDSCSAQRLGRHALPAGALRTDYPRPQANGRRGRLRRLSLALAGGTTLGIEVLDGPDDAGFTLSPWSQAELAAATHPHALPAPSSWELVIDAGQHGLGSRSCGVDVPARHALTADRARLVLAFTLTHTTPGSRTTPESRTIVKETPWP
ncbi:glycoside hydrolase family 2 TIM barrel-domain containing protein [Zafaria sp. Z1313]|uniref:glycoside hydrolase family 2 TIM barrel-domain containing protein n=1 Tax=unclassified Zafaria TaxID=2828765 RepID=UPI002E759B2F|nr:glycoside hydrolase family 2 TIM barrel-domain containing protein [Zafaria sp. J156]MEE1621535.1 glycoside hydrolase family 2 TIM barrel-domain containing protein [Zafaria sp. J156]